MAEEDHSQGSISRAKLALHALVVVILLGIGAYLIYYLYRS